MSTSVYEAPELPLIRYSKKEEPFARIMRERVNAYFRDQHLSKFANPPMVGKAFFQFFLWTGLYALIISNQFQGWSLFFLQLAFYFTVFLVSVGIAHDGSHNAFSANPKVNGAMNRVFDFIGINSYMWDFNHIKSHHNVPNIPLYDSAIDSFKLFRFHPRAAYFKFHRYQQYYILAIYAFATLFKIFFLDFFSFSRNRIGFIKMEEHSRKEILWLVTTKLVVITYMLVLPLTILDAPAWQIIAGFLCGNFIAGIALGVIFQVTHLCDYTRWPEPDNNGIINNSFARHIMETTSDFCPYNRVVTWIAGGLNNHVAHHLFPDISQIHLPALTKIVKATAVEFDVPYKAYPTVGAALRSHFYTLKKLGEEKKSLYQVPTT
ncbi:MAG: fatty acid desaturase family protein [Lewinella sp.]|jgi:linoleoyl-CoA desaturase|uniref:fatty acid desaturase family protein n=1 Tax=Lewinella sp. TaxID=2004506 RepID=UPI003D6AA3C8